MTCTTLRQLLFAGMQQRGYENPADGRPRDATEVLKALLEILRVPDTLRVQRRAEIRLEGDSEKWIQRDKNPAPEPHGTVWTAHLPSTARTVGQALHSCEEQEVEARLDDEDMQEMARLHGAPLPTPRYARRKDTMKLVGVQSGLFFVEMSRIYLGKDNRPRRAAVAFSPDSIQFGDATFHVASVVCHARNHYTCVLRHGGGWSRAPPPAPVRPHRRQAPHAVLYVYGRADNAICGALGCNTVTQGRTP